MTSPSQDISVTVVWTNLRYALNTVYLSYEDLSYIVGPAYSVQTLLSKGGIPHGMKGLRVYQPFTT